MSVKTNNREARRGRAGCCGTRLRATGGPIDPKLPVVMIRCRAAWFVRQRRSTAPLVGRWTQLGPGFLAGEIHCGSGRLPTN